MPPCPDPVLKLVFYMAVYSPDVPVMKLARSACGVAGSVDEVESPARGEGAVGLEGWPDDDGTGRSEAPEVVCWKAVAPG